MDESDTIEPSPAQSRVYIAGMGVERSGIEPVVDRIWADVRSPAPHAFVSVNANSATLRRTCPGYAEAMASRRAVPVADGVSVTLGALLLGYGRIGRVPGVDVMDAACRRAAGDGTTFYFLGGDPGVAAKLASELALAHPDLQVAGASTPPYGAWSAEDSARIIGGVRNSGAEVLWLGVAAGRQEVWAVEHIESLGMPVVCVGAAFDFLSGSKPRAPRWMRRAGLEWLFRLLSEPRRLWRRYTVGNAVFLADLVRMGRSPSK